MISLLPPKAQKEKVGGLGPNFWFFRESENTPLPYGYAEIDVYEQVDLSKSNKHSPYLFGPTIHFDANNADLGRIQNDVYGKIGWKEQTDTDVPLNYFVDFSDGQFHKIGFEWQKDYVTYYVDGKECGSINFEQDKIVAMNAYLDLNISPKSSDLTATVFPFKYEIDYFRYYQFATNSNPQPLTLTTGNYSNSTLGYTKRLNITIGGIGLQAKVQTGTSLTLRADEYILLDEGFEIDDETTMYMQVTTR